MSRYRDSDALDCKVYVGDLGSGANKQDLEEAFSHYGPLRNVWVARNPPGFAFIEYEDGRDAEDGVRGLDGRTVCGRRVRVELSTGKSKRRFRGPPNRGRPFHPEDCCYECGERGHYARDCSRHGRDGRRRSRSHSHSRRSRSRSRSRGRQSKTPSRSRSRSRSRTPSRGRTPSASHSRSRSRSHSRSGARSNASGSPANAMHNGASGSGTGGGGGGPN